MRRKVTLVDFQQAYATGSARTAAGVFRGGDLAGVGSVPPGSRSARCVPRAFLIAVGVFGGPLRVMTYPEEIRIFKT